MSIANMATHKGWYNTRRRMIRSMCRAKPDLAGDAVFILVVFGVCRVLSRKQSRRLRQLKRQARQD